MSITLKFQVSFTFHILLTIIIKGLEPNIMPSKKKKYNARFPAGRIKKIMQTDEEVGKVAQAVPVIISRTLELFVESLLIKSMHITQARSAKTLTPSHMKQCILSESRFDFLKDLVKDVPDPSTQEDNENNAKESDYFQNKLHDQTSLQSFESKKSMINFYTEQGTSSSRTPVIQYGPSVKQELELSKSNFSDDCVLDNNAELVDTKYHLDLSHVQHENSFDKSTSVSQLVPNVYKNQVPASTPYTHNQSFQNSKVNVPPLIPISHNTLFGQNTGDNLYIDEDYDN